MADNFTSFTSPFILFSVSSLSFLCSRCKASKRLYRNNHKLLWETNRRNTDQRRQDKSNTPSLTAYLSVFLQSVPEFSRFPFIFRRHLKRHSADCLLDFQAKLEKKWISETLSEFLVIWMKWILFLLEHKSEGFPLFFSWNIFNSKLTCVAILLP